MKQLNEVYPSHFQGMELHLSNCFEFYDTNSTRNCLRITSKIELVLKTFKDEVFQKHLQYRHLQAIGMSSELGVFASEKCQNKYENKLIKVEKA